MVAFWISIIISVIAATSIFGSGEENALLGFAMLTFMNNIIIFTSTSNLNTSQNQSRVWK
jgi:hypothetical protein